MSRKAQTSAGPVNAPFRRVRIVLYTLAALFSLAGIADATYLTIQHLTGESLVCGTGDCGKVLGSAYSAIGPIPLAALGALAYFTVFSCATLAAFSYARAHTFLAITVGLMFLVTCFLLYAQAFLLHAFCTYCLFSAAIVFCLAGLIIATPPPPKTV